MNDVFPFIIIEDSLVISGVVGIQLSSTFFVFILQNHPIRTQYSKSDRPIRTQDVGAITPYCIQHIESEIYESHAKCMF